MGRKKIYNTQEEKHEAEKAKKRRWYWRNADKIRKINLEYYHVNK